MGVEVFVADEQTEFPVDNLRWLHLAEQVLAAEGVRGDAELSILFVDPAAMAELNERFHAQPGPTDVLAFPIDDEPSEGGRNPDAGGPGPGYVPPEPSQLPTLLGDVVICPGVATRNATEHDNTYDDEVAPLAFMRGRTLNNSFIILDEAQNTTPEQMKMFLTRIGYGSKVVVTGDITQVDIAGGRSGLIGLEEVLGGIDDIAFVRLTGRDVVRHRIVQDIVDAYERAGTI